MPERESNSTKEELIKGETWSRPFNPLVIEVFKDYVNEGGHLFAATGDLDNLGVYVARNGRARAENLVDLYNQTIRNYLEGWVSENEKKIISFAFVPSGEEVLIVGVARATEIPKRLFDGLRDGISKLMESQEYLDIGNTSASFGGVVFGDKYDIVLKGLVENYDSSESDETVYPKYLDILTGIRTETAFELDKNKFQDILRGDYPVEVRQLVLTRMLLYKRTTKEILISLNRLSHDEVLLLLDMLGEVYGIEPGLEDQVDKLYKSLIDKKDE